uniref:UDP-glucuronosyltransferase 2B33 n=2 Tax=Culex pipiens TaxID=7175 RepID=A0A8D8CBA7_CULPI
MGHLSVLKVVIWLEFVIIARCSNILVLMSVPSPSHFIWIRPIMNQLAQHGHNITALSVNTDPNAAENITYIHLENTYNVLYGDGKASNNILKRSEENPFQATMSFYKFGTLGCIGATSSLGLQKLMEYPDDFRFDLVIYDFTCGPCVLGFLHKFNYPPLVSLTGFSIPQFSHHLVGGHKPSSYVPHFSLKYDTKMDFFQRTINFIVQNFDSIYREWVFLPHMQGMAQEAFNFTLPNLAELEQRTQIMLVNTNPVLDPPETLPQNVIPVGGLQIVQPKPVMEEISNFIERSSKGTVLFAMGTNFKSKMFTRDRQAMFIEAFALLPEYNFLWKFDDDNLPIPAPKNLMVRAWLPQNDILAHPRLKAFITHCGLLSTYEASYHGVPTIGIPIYVDQHRNAQRSTRAEVGVTLDLKNLSTEAIRRALLRVLTEEKFATNMAKRAQLLRDQTESPLDRAVWWIEWVLRHPHSNHMRSPMLDLGYFAKSNIDVFVFLCLLVTIGLTAILKCKNLMKKSHETDCDKKKK